LIKLSLLRIIDPKTIREEITKALEKEDSNEKLSKQVRALITNLKSSTQQSVSLVSKQQQHQHQQQHQPDLNYLMALSLVAMKKPQLFLKQPSLVEVS
jgi:hypothetical protein